MTKGNSSQKFIGRNRAPRVQIEYDVELYGAEQKVELPFVMGVMSDLSGQPDPDNPLPPVDQRKFLEISVDNFDDRMAAMTPRVAFNVPNTISGQGQVPVELRFNKMEDFSPAAVANQVEPLRRLLEMRERIASLLTYMDGKVDAERYVSELLQDPKRLSQLAAAAPALPADTRDDSDNNGAAQ